MIARVQGTLVAKELDRVEIFNSGGVAYALALPLGGYGPVPRVGEEVDVPMHPVVRGGAGDSRSKGPLGG